MAVNDNGNLLDSAGNICVDRVWGNMPMQPNDARSEAVQGDLDAALNDHVIAYAQWNGYPLYTPNDDGAGVGYVVVPNVVNETTSVATDVMDDAGLTVTVASGAANNTVSVTEITRPSGSVTITFVSTNTFTAGENVRVATTGEASLDADYVVKFSNGAIFTADGTDTTTVALSGLSATAKRVPGTIKQQSVSAGAATIAVGQAVTITPWA